MTVSFDGQVALVTGAGNGLGRGYALELARRGARVVVNDPGGAADGTGASSAADLVVAEIRAAGGEAVASHDSVASPEGGTAIVDTAVGTFGRLDVLVHNAGILRDASFTKLAVADLDAVLDVHLRGAFFVCQPAFRHMKEQGYGRILLTSSAAGLFGNFGQANYAAAKMGLVGLANVLSVEGARCGVNCNVLAPAAKTRLTEDLMPGYLGGAMRSDLVTPIALYLVSRECEVTHEIFSAVAGRYSRIFIGSTPGWFPGPNAVVAVEDVRAHLDEIRRQEGYSVHGNATEEMTSLFAKLTGSPG